MQEALFYSFSLERHVPDDHLLRKIDRFVDLSGLRAQLGPYYSDVGRPSIDPEAITVVVDFLHPPGYRATKEITCPEPA